MCCIVLSKYLDKFLMNAFISFGSSSNFSYSSFLHDVFNKYQINLINYWKHAHEKLLGCLTPEYLETYFNNRFQALP